jgi:hypothetical protein
LKSFYTCPLIFAAVITCQIVLLALIDSMFEADSELDVTPSLNRTFDSFSEAECYNYFETRKENLGRLFRALQMPDKIVLENGSTLSGEDVMLRGLYELVGDWE